MPPTAITRRIDAEIEALRRAAHVGPLTTSFGFPVALLPSRHPAEPVLLALRQAWTRRRWFQGCAIAFPLTKIGSIAAARVEAERIRDLIRELRGLICTMPAMLAMKDAA